MNSSMDNDYQANLNSVLPLVCEYLNQNDVFNLTLCCTTFNKSLQRYLFKSIIIQTEPVLRDVRSHLDWNTTYITGCRNIIKSNDQNDIYVYDRVEELIRSGKLHLIEKLVIEKDIFFDKDNGNALLIKLIERIIEIDLIKVLEIKDYDLFSNFYDSYLKLTHLTKIEVIELDDLENTKSLFTLREIVLTLINDNERQIINLSENTKKILRSNIKSVHINDVDYASGEIINLLKRNHISFPKAQNISFKHVHRLECGPITDINLGNIFDLKKIKALEAVINCEEYGHCSCLDEFLTKIRDDLIVINKLALSQKHFITVPNHKEQEDWDIIICRFLVNIPDVDSNLSTLIIKHDPPFEGFAEDSVDGNYIRRKNLFMSVFPVLKALRSLWAPVVLQTISAYEVPMADILWNGCECEYCKKWLPVFDQYLMNHQYYSKDEGDYKDIIPTPFAAFTGYSLAKRVIDDVNSLLELTTRAPHMFNWDFHTYDAIRHFETYECHFDERVFPMLGTAISHFFYNYMDFLVKHLPNLAFTQFSGIYFTVKDQKYDCIYD